MLPSHCIVNKKLLPFFAHYRIYLGAVLLDERAQQFRQVDQGTILGLRRIDAIISQFPDIVDSQDVVDELIKHWDVVL